MDKYSYINDTPGKRFLKALGVGVAVGVFYAVFYLWAFEWSLRSLLAALAAGATSGAVFGIVAGLLTRTSRSLLFAAAPFAGAAGGGVWWTVYRPELGLGWCVAVGAMVVLVLLVLAELGDRV